jgi:REP element-mobilizing transposase RayT
MARYWLLTSSFYGTWLPGDRRGFVGRVRDARPEDPPTTNRIEHNIPGTPCDQDMPGLERASAERLKGPPIYVGAEHAEILIRQFSETTAFRKWKILAAAVMANHIHLVVETPDDADPTKVLGDFKAYGARALTARFGKPQSGTWWTYGGSKRSLPDDQAVAAAVTYVLHKQDNSLLTWSPSEETASGVA